MQDQAPAIPDRRVDSVPRLLLFSGSLRRESHQSRLLRHFVSVLGSACDIDMLTPADVDLPLFDQDLEQSELVLAKVIGLHHRFESADGLIVASPEYNGHVSSYLKNTVDWVSRLPRIDSRYAARNAFHGRPLLLASASTGWTGGILGLQNARSIFSYLGCTVVADQICVSDAEQCIVDDRFRFHDGFAEHIENVLKRFVTVVESLRSARAAA
ncbi:MAG: NAD(P)H-dependent oxidoreductase [Rhodopseudomonas sp.]|uniref:NADPH-dependent FMN reductase n=1 Tax=Rhodopseudomonas sp. TaxID=1078 RepID=UPI00183869A0|nr:NAD(P)H-dependent oxidoreductase [Rhodopseudomonas sp.]NVN88062.1 NAD(P)H-dependent oxidoreductase [Rhodopseudomonas sp.]